MEDSLKYPKYCIKRKFCEGTRSLFSWNLLRVNNEHFTDAMDFLQLIIPPIPEE